MTKSRNKNIVYEAMIAEKNSVDVVIIGGGPAGISAASWCADLGLDTLLIERADDLGGQLKNIHNPVSNYLGVRAGNGNELLERFLDAIKDSSFARAARSDVSSIDPTRMLTRLADGSEIISRAIVIATGVRRRHLGIPGELEFHGKGVLESGARDGRMASGKSALIVGGGDAALENALILSEFASDVAVVFRRSEPTARREFIDEARRRKNVRFISETIVTEIRGDSSVRAVELAKNGDRRIEEVESVLIRIGIEPNSELVRGIVDLNGDGYVVVDHAGRTSVHNIFAIGDVAHPFSPTIATAVGSGATAAKTIYCSLAS